MVNPNMNHDNHSQVQSDSIIDESSIPSQCSIERDCSAASCPPGEPSRLSIEQESGHDNELLAGDSPKLLPKANDSDNDTDLLHPSYRASVARLCKGSKKWSSLSALVNLLSKATEPRSSRTEAETSKTLSSQDSATTATLINTQSENGEEEYDEDDEESEHIQCPICQDVMTDVFMTRCGHSYCYKCISQHIECNADCPLCRSPLSSSQIFPNFHLNSLVEQHARLSVTHAAKLSRQLRRLLSQRRGPKDLGSVVDHLVKSLHYDDLMQVLSTALEKKKRSESDNTDMKHHLLNYFLCRLRSDNVKMIAELNQQVDRVEKDLRRTSKESTSPDRVPGSSPEDLGGDLLEKKHDRHQHDVFSIRAGKKRSHDEMTQADAYESLSSEDEREYEAATKRMRIDDRMSDFRNIYFHTDTSDESQLETFSDTLFAITRYREFQAVDTVYYADVGSPTAIVSSIEFDRDEEYFAVGGVTKEIKIYDFSLLNHNATGSINDINDINDCKPMNKRPAKGHDHVSTFIHAKRSPTIIHCPIRVMQCNNKISCLSWNTYIKSNLASSDYGGIVSTWDVSTGQVVQTFHEHKRRAWSVDTCAKNPSLLVSGSDDSTVKIWSLQSRHSVCTLEQKGNVCCAKFAPNNTNHIAVGSADHHVSCYDLRYHAQPFHVLNGHQKAVSYVKWMGDDSVVSASTDSTLKLWSLEDGDCKCTFSGHQNEKNFVGLSVSDDWISCGSETNTLYTYHKHSSIPVLTYKFPAVDLPMSADEDPPSFVSSVCWKQDASTILAANSRGMVKVLCLRE